MNKDYHYFSAVIMLYSIQIPKMTNDAISDGYGTEFMKRVHGRHTSGALAYNGNLRPSPLGLKRNMKNQKHNQTYIH